jgi:hypothetical protein
VLGEVVQDLIQEALLDHRLPRLIRGLGDGLTEVLEETRHTDHIHGQVSRKASRSPAYLYPRKLLNSKEDDT